MDYKKHAKQLAATIRGLRANYPDGRYVRNNLFVTRAYPEASGEDTAKLWNGADIMLQAYENDLAAAPQEDAPSAHGSWFPTKNLSEFLFQAVCAIDGEAPKSIPSDQLQQVLNNLLAKIKMLAEKKAAKQTPPAKPPFMSAPTDLVDTIRQYHSDVAERESIRGEGFSALELADRIMKGSANQTGAPWYQPWQRQDPPKDLVEAIRSYVRKNTSLDDHNLSSENLARHLMEEGAKAAPDYEIAWIQPYLIKQAKDYVSVTDCSCKITDGIPTQCWRCLFAYALNHLPHAKMIEIGTNKKPVSVDECSAHDQYVKDQMQAQSKAVPNPVEKALSSAYHRATGPLTDSDWLQLEMAAAGCTSGIANWPRLRAAIQKVRQYKGLISPVEIPSESGSGNNVPVAPATSPITSTHHFLCLNAKCRHDNTRRGALEDDAKCTKCGEPLDGGVRIKIGLDKDPHTTDCRPWHVVIEFEHTTYTTRVEAIDQNSALELARTKHALSVGGLRSAKRLIVEPMA